MKGNQGITFIEILLVIAIIAILAASISPFLSSFVLRNNHDTVRSRLIGSLRKAQSFSMSKKDGQIWGVCLPDSTTIRLYSSSCNSPAFSQDFTFSSTISITGFSDISFSKLRGEPSDTVSIDVSSRLDSDTITVNSVGRIAIE